MNGTSRYREATNRRCFITILHWNQDSAMRVDLHCHSTASDGARARRPGAAAHEKGVGLLALTDHDTLEGLPEAHQAAARLGIELVNGIELSCTWGGATIHVLGYGFDLDAAPCARRPKPCTGAAGRAPRKSTGGLRPRVCPVRWRARGRSSGPWATAATRRRGRISPNSWSRAAGSRIAPTRSASGWGRQAGRRQAALADPGGSGRLPARGARLDQPGAPVSL